MSDNLLNTINQTAVSQTGSPALVRSVRRQELPQDGQGVPLSDEHRPAPPREEVERAVSRMNDYVQLVQRDLQFSIDDDTGKTVVKVLDSGSGNVIRQFPSEEMIAISRIISENLEKVEGIILHDKA